MKVSWRKIAIALIDLHASGPSATRPFVTFGGYAARAVRAIMSQ